MDSRCLGDKVLQLGCTLRCFLTSLANLTSQNRPQLIANPISQFLRIGQDIGIGFFELTTPKLSSVAYINQFHMQK